MTSPAVVIEIAAPDAASPLAATLAQACTGASAEGPCVLSSSGADGAAPRAIAIVTWSAGDRRSVRIELGRKLPAGPRWISRELSFKPEDAEIERWRATGLVIATLASGAESEEPAAPPPRPAAEPARPAPRADRAARPPAPLHAPREAPSPVAIWLDAGAGAGPALDDGTWRVGPAARATVAFARVPVLALASFRYSVRPTDERGVAIRWTSISLGAGGHVAPVAVLRLDARLELVAESIDAAVTDPATGAEDSGGRWVAGGRAGIDAAWMPLPSLGVTAGVDATLVRSGTVVRVERAPLARAAPLAIGPTLGLRLVLPWRSPP